MGKTSLVLVLVVMTCMVEQSLGLGTYYWPSLAAPQYGLSQFPPLSAILTTDCDKKEESSSSSSSSESKEEKKEEKEEGGKSSEEKEGEEKKEEEEIKEEVEEKIEEEKKEEGESKESKESGEEKEKEKEKKEKKEKKKKEFEYVFPPVAYTVPRPVQNIMYATPYNYQPYGAYNVMPQASYPIKANTYSYVYQPTSRILSNKMYSGSYGARIVAGSPSYWGGNLGYYKA